MSSSGNWKRRDIAASAIKHVFYPLWALKNGSPRLRYLDELEKSQYLPMAEILDQQWLLFKKMVGHAYETCPYYRKTFRKADFTPADLRSRDDIKHIPCITKQEIQEFRAEMISSDFSKANLINDMTGGSTGSPMEFRYSEDRLDSRVAATLRHNRWAGWDMGDRAAILWGAPRDIPGGGSAKSRFRDWVLERRLILDASALDDRAMAKFAQELVHYQPTVLLAYANTLGLFAQYVKDNRITDITPRAVICSAEFLTEENRKLIEDTFRCQVFNRYGCREFAVIASECSVHSGMHINAENLLVETLANGESRHDVDGEIVITDLRNMAMPMIRYRIGDVGHLVKEACQCGRGLPLMKLTGGRTTDFLLKTDGKKVSGIVVATYVITNIAGIRQIQFIQNKIGAVTVNLVKGSEWSQNTQDILASRIREYLGTDMQVEVMFRDSIPLEKSGKYRFSVSTLTV